MTTDKTVTIVTGIARGGANAVMDMLNAHQNACIGYSRYKFKFLRHGIYDPDFFDKSRFFRFRKADTNLSPEKAPKVAALYDKMRDKWDDAAVVGDMIPDLFQKEHEVLKAYPQVRIVSVLRNLKDVALSWDALAHKKNSNWPKDKDFVKACIHWEQQNRTLLETISNPKFASRMFLLDFDTLPSQSLETGQALLDFLNLPEAAGFSAELERHAHYQAQQPGRTIPEKFHEIYKLVDMTPARRLRKLARPEAPSAPSQS
jgi:hypothetical protein